MNVLATVLLLLTFAACKKYNSAGFTPGTGAPAISSVHTYSKTDTTTRMDTVVAYDSSGTKSLSFKFKSNFVTPFDSTTTAGNLGNYYIIYGSNLGSTTKITFNGANAYFNRALITDKSLVVQIPSTTPFIGPSATDSLVVTTLYGKAWYKFRIIPPPPTVNAMSDYNFWTGSQISLKGVGFTSISSVGLTGTAATVTVVQKTDTTMTLQFPSTTVSRASVVFTFSLTGAPQTGTMAMELIDLDNAYAIFYKDNFQNSWIDNSWSHPSGPSTEATHSAPGTSSLRANYPAGAWQIEGWAGWNGPGGGFSYDAGYKYLTFWVKGGTADHTLVLVGDQMIGGYGQIQLSAAMAIQKIPTPKGVWTYYRIPLGTGANQLNFWAGGNLAKQLGFFLQGQSGDVDEVMYFDEVAFVK